MSVADKIALACHDFAAVAHLGLPALSFTDGGNGVRVADDATAFPACVSLAASFDEQLAYRFGSAVGQEARSRRSQRPARAGAGHRAHAAGRAAGRGVRGRPVPDRSPGSGVRPGRPAERRGHGQALRGEQLRDGPDRVRLAAIGPRASGRRPRLPPGPGRDLLPAVPARSHRRRRRVRHGFLQPGQRLLRLPESGIARHAERPVGMGGIRRPRLHVRGARSGGGRAGGP